MDAGRKIRLEYEEQYFNLSSELILESFKNLLKNATASGVRSAIKLIRKKVSPVAVDLSELEAALQEATDSLIAEFAQGVEYAMGITDPKIRECFNIPDWVICDEDIIAQKYAETDIVSLDEDICNLKQELKNIEFMMVTTKEEIAVADKAIKILEDADSHSPGSLSADCNISLANLSLRNV